MMTIKVLTEFHDKDNFAMIYRVGEVYQFEKERAKELIRLGIAEAYKVEEKPKRAKASE